MVLKTFFILFMLMPCLSNQGLNPAVPEKVDTTDAASPQMENEDIRQFCYASKTKAATDIPGTHYNYEFIRLWIEGEEVRGTWRHYPYGTDRMEASLTGVYKEETGEVHLQADMYGEGMFYQQTRSLGMLENALQLDYQDQQQKPATIPQVSCAVFDELLEEFYAGILRQTVNTTDRSRLLKVSALSAMGMTRQGLEKATFMEREVDLDRNYQTREFLLYVMDPMVCGSGGCNLFVINENGDVLSQTTVVKLPVYTTISSIEDERKQQGTWKELYVWSQGLRRLTPDKDGKYPANASDGFPVVREQVALHPERFRLLLDYLDN